MTLIIILIVITVFLAFTAIGLSIWAMIENKKAKELRKKAEELKLKAERVRLEAKELRLRAKGEKRKDDCGDCDNG